MDLAKKVGLSQAMVSKMENDCRSAKPETLKAIAAELNCTVEDITGETGLFIRFVRNAKKLKHNQLETINNLILHLTRFNGNTKPESKTMTITWYPAVGTPVKYENVVRITNYGPSVDLTLKDGMEITLVGGSYIQE